MTVTSNAPAGGGQIVGALVTCKCGQVGTFTAPGEASNAGSRVAVDMTVESQARAAGWRVWSGVTLAGAPSLVVLCPICAGTATPEQVVVMTGWRAECETCGWSSDDDEDDEELLSEADAGRSGRYHECETEVWLHGPDGVRKRA